ncbi:15883_t:CDS:1, partial [Acaulospora colombiana]
MTAEELLKPLPHEVKKIPRSMNCFLCFRRKIYLLAVSGGFVDDIRDGRFLTRVVTKIWNNISKEKKGIYVRLAKEVRKIDHDRYKGVRIKKKIIGENQFVNTYMVNYSPTSRKGKNDLISSHTGNPSQHQGSPVVEMTNYSLPSFVENPATIVPANDAFNNKIGDFSFVLPIYDYYYPYYFNLLNQEELPNPSYEHCYR